MLLLIYDKYSIVDSLSQMTIYDVYNISSSKLISTMWIDSNQILNDTLQKLYAINQLKTFDGSCDIFSYSGDECSYQEVWSSMQLYEIPIFINN